MPKLGVDEPIVAGTSISTGKDRSWTERQGYVLREVFDSMTELIEFAKAPQVWKSLSNNKAKGAY